MIEHFLRRRHADGGYCGFPSVHLQHLASSYAAVNALVIIGTERALASIDRFVFVCFLFFCFLFFFSVLKLLVQASDVSFFDVAQASEWRLYYAR